VLDIESLTPLTRRQLACWPRKDFERLRVGSLSLPPRVPGRRSIVPRASSMRGYIDSYTRGQKWLQQKGWFDANQSADERWTGARMQLYVDESLAFGHKPNTVRGRVIGIWRVVSMMAPERNLRFLLSPLEALSRATTRDKSQIPHLKDLIECGLNTMERARQAPKTMRTAIAYRTGLQIAWLASLGLRLANLGRVAEGRDNNLWETDNAWWVVFEAAETKNHKPIDKPFPPELLPYLLEYREVFRPILCRGRYGRGGGYSGNRLWVSSRGGEQSLISIYKNVVSTTRRELGITVGPHLFRDAIATAMASSSPAQASGARLRLGNTLEVVERHYSHASTLEASRIAMKRLMNLGKPRNGCIGECVFRT